MSSHQERAEFVPRGAPQKTSHDSIASENAESRIMDSAPKLNLGAIPDEFHNFILI